MTVTTIQYRNGKLMSWIVPCGKTCGRNDVHNHLVFRNEQNVFACNCVCGQVGKYACRHIKAVWVEMIAESINCRVSFWKTPIEAKRQRRHTYTVKMSGGVAYATIRRMV